MEADHRLVERVLAGDRAALHELIGRHERLVQHIVFRLVPERADAEEVCQDVLVRVCRGLPRFRGESKLSTWIGRIAYRTALKRLEKRTMSVSGLPDPHDADLRGAGEATDPSPTALDALVGEELRAYVRRQVQLLPAEQRAVVTLYHLDELSVAEVADVMDMPPGTVKSHLFRARKWLKAKLEERIGGSHDE
jgi:RNA polymerase sigma factor (sigma-70 family)